MHRDVPPAGEHGLQGHAAPHALQACARGGSSLTSVRRHLHIPCCPDPLACSSCEVDKSACIRRGSSQTAGGEHWRQHGGLGVAGAAGVHHRRQQGRGGRGAGDPDGEDRNTLHRPAACPLFLRAAQYPGLSAACRCAAACLVAWAWSTDVVTSCAGAGQRQMGNALRCRTPC